MQFTDDEFRALYESPKIIVADIEWQIDSDHPLSQEFVVEIEMDAGYPLRVKGTFNPHVPALSYMLILPTPIGRIYGLDLGKDHHNPTCSYTGDKHKHTWSEEVRDKEAHVPNDVTASPKDVLAAWEQFCNEVNIDHRGTMKSPNELTEDLFL